MRKILVATIVCLSLCISSVNVMAADPSVDNVTVVPAEPERESTITITANITSDDTISDVKLKIKECTATFCHTEEEFTMSFVNGNYEYQHDLQWADAIYFNYSFVITYDSQEFETEETKVLLKIDSGNGGTNGGGNGNGSPGFEIITLLAAIAIGILLLKRKRS